jgi:hypothetical protein
LSGGETNKRKQPDYLKKRADTIVAAIVAELSKHGP